MIEWSLLVKLYKFYEVQLYHLLYLNLTPYAWDHINYKVENI
jgi:hypothetical protein